MLLPIFFLGTVQSQEERASKGRKGARPSQGTSRLGLATAGTWRVLGAAARPTRHCQDFRSPSPTHACLTSLLPRWPSWLLRQSPARVLPVGPLLHRPPSPPTGGQQHTMPNRRPDKAAPHSSRRLRPQPPPPQCKNKGRASFRAFQLQDRFFKHNHPQRVHIEWRRPELLCVKGEGAGSWGN